MNVLIFGGSCDIGRCMAEYFISLGYKVIATYNSHKFSINNIDTIKCDIRSENDIEEAIKYVINNYGNIDILINLVAICMDNSFLNKTKNEFMSVLEVNLVGTFLINQIYSRYIDNGLIINMASSDGIDTYNEYNIDYAASKAGVINMSRNISNYTSNKVLCICPNWIDTDSVRSMNQDFLKSELKRIGQDRLLTINEVVHSIYKIMKGKFTSGSVYRIDVREGKLWIEEV